MLRQRANKQTEEKRILPASVLGPKRAWGAVEIGLWQDKKECGLAVDTKEKDIPSPQAHAEAADHKGPRVSPAFPHATIITSLSALPLRSVRDHN